MKKEEKGIELDIIDYDVLIVALRSSELYQTEITEEYYNELISKLEKNRNKLEYNNNLIL